MCQTYNKEIYNYYFIHNVLIPQDITHPKDLNIIIYIYMGAKGDWDFQISDLVKKKPDGTDI